MFDGDEIPPEPIEDPPTPSTEEEDKVVQAVKLFSAHKEHRRTTSVELIKDAEILKESAASFKDKQNLFERTSRSNSLDDQKRGNRSGSEVKRSEQQKITRKKIIEEIISTEESYCKGLAVLVDAYYSAFQDSSKVILTAEKINDIFSNVQLILNLNNNLLSNLKKAYQGFEESQMIGKVFVDFAPYLKMYTTYVNNHENAFKIIQKETQRNEKFRKFCENALLNPKCAGLSLESYLIMPVQRIPRYKLLLEQLLKFTNQDHQDFQNLNQALKLVSVVALHVNEQVRKRENTEKILSIQSLFGDDVNFVVPGRFYVFDGKLKKVCRKADKKFYFILFNDSFAYGSERVLGYQLHHLIPINNAFSVDDLPDYDGKFRFKINSIEKSFILYAEDLLIKRRWLECLKKCVDESMLSPRLNTVAGDIAPVWTADGHSKCEICSTEFSIVKRRHHCRNCGRLVCGTCSSHREILYKSKSKEKERVCDPCYAELSLRIKNSSKLDDEVISLNNSISNRSINTSPSNALNDSDASDDDEYDDGNEDEFVDTVELAEALVDFKASEPSELSYSKGDYVIVRDKSTSNGTILVTHKATGMIGRVDPAKFKFPNSKRMFSSDASSLADLRKMNPSHIVKSGPNSQRNSFMLKFENMFTSKKRESLMIDPAASPLRKETDLSSPPVSSILQSSSPTNLARDNSSDEAIVMSPVGLNRDSSVASLESPANQKLRMDSRSRGSAIISGRAKESTMKELPNPNGPCFKCVSCTGFQPSGMALICSICSHHKTSHK